MKERETFASRLGFVLISAGCAIGLGNVWRFPYIVGQYGGAAFVVIYIMFLLIMGLPIMSMEFSVGRASRKSITMSFQELEPKGTKWHWYGWFGMAGNYLLMMFYTTIAGWLLLYFFKVASGQFEGMDHRPGQRGLYRHADPGRGNPAAVYGHGGGAGHGGVQPRPEKRRGEGQQGHDALPAGPAGGAGGAGR